MRTWHLLRWVGFEVAKRKQTGSLNQSPVCAGRQVYEHLSLEKGPVAISAATCAPPAQPPSQFMPCPGQRAGPVFCLCPSCTHRESAAHLVRSGPPARPLRRDAAEGSESLQTAAPSSHVTAYRKRYQAPGLGGAFLHSGHGQMGSNLHACLHPVSTTKTNQE